ncbi:hypothetical protein [Streptomyces radiopugnans]|uniref:Secreted protein n=1 Tax=Streptomyces radiopugnans TaxID=403935 RepID=A0A1H9ENU1_9ACTN|nr:hypothetical protein [Streptomyces radiopugnans]SEQ27426.1 hypothetical protein SAMN05216481_105229 [Streptomyces radiopugnans]
MRRRTRAAITAAAALLAATALPGAATAAASTAASTAGSTVAGTGATADATAAAARVPWSVRHGSASASGERWVETSVAGIFHTLVIRGELTGSGSGCHSLWIRYTYDLAPAPPRKYAEVCGSGSTPVALRHQYRPTTSGYLTVCRGTDDTEDCAAWQNITWWPVSGG